VADRKYIFKNNRPILFIWAFLFIALNAKAQNWPFEVWHEGKIVLVSGDTLKGMVKYDLQQDLVQHAVRTNTAEVYTARKVLFFEIFDEGVRKYRRFFALPFTTSTGYRAPVFFELLQEGKMTLLAREYLERKTYSSPYYFGSSYSRLVLSYKYYFLKENGDIQEFTGNKNDLLDMMGKKSDDVEKYMRKNRLRFDDKDDLTKIIEYYNSIAGS
jgi:hypothetical protein